MGRKRHILLAALLVALVGALASVIFRPREPMYQGKPLSFWLEAYYKPSGTREGTSVQADQAVLAIGTNAIPTYLRLLQAHDAPWKISVFHLLQKQHVIKIRFTSAIEQNNDAWIAFQVLGAHAAGAVPSLIEIFDRKISRSSRACAAMCLGEIGTSARSAVPTLVKALTNANSNGLPRYYLVIALGKIHSEPELSVPALIRCLSDPDRQISGGTLEALSAFGPNARAAVPKLIALLNDPRDNISKAATNALLHIDPEAAAKAGVK